MATMEELADQVAHATTGKEVRGAIAEGFGQFDQVKGEVFRRVKAVEDDIYSGTSFCGVIGYPKNARHPLRIAPSQIASVPCNKIFDIICSSFTGKFQFADAITSQP